VAKKPSSIDVHAGPGNRYRHRTGGPSSKLVNALARFEVADISDQLNRLFAMRAPLKNQANAERLCGPACTVKVFPGDNLMVHKALDVARPGDVVVVDCAGCFTTAIIGDMIAQKAKHRGIAGFVIDGLVRDQSMLRKVGLPVFARGVTPVGPLHRGPGEINYPVACGGVVVHPGDIISADGDGVVVIPHDSAADVLRRLSEQEARLVAYVADLAEGNFSNEWVDALLDVSKCARQE
jgi:RraA family protein